MSLFVIDTKIVLNMQIFLFLKTFSLFLYNLFLFLKLILLQQSYLWYCQSVVLICRMILCPYFGCA